MAPLKALPLPLAFEDEEAYVKSLLAFATTHNLFQKLCGGVHILDFFTQEPDLYSALLPLEWRTWFNDQEVSDVLDLLMREDLSHFGNKSHLNATNVCCEAAESEWHNGPNPPASLLQYIKEIRKHTLDREAHTLERRDNPSRGVRKLARPVTVGMKPKKIHEVEHFVEYIDGLTIYINARTEHQVSHIVDFGSGQNYLGRALASPPHCRSVVAIESKPHNIGGAKAMDVFANLAEKEKVMRNKKDFRTGQGKTSNHFNSSDSSTPNNPTPAALKISTITAPQGSSEVGNECLGSLQYLEAIICNGDLSTIVPKITIRKNAGGVAATATGSPQLLVVSLHSCGNLVHHGLRSLVLNPSVKAVAMIGCCYNLMTERLGPPTYKLPSLRHSNERLFKTSNAYDPHGFPMSERLMMYKHEHGEGFRLNITSRMMAVQAPRNWTSEESEDFFTRHFYRALLQRIFVDKGILSRPTVNADSTNSQSPRGWTGGEHAIILGSLRKSCYTSFVAYVRGAFKKLRDDVNYGYRVMKLDHELTDEEVVGYEDAYSGRRKELSIVWSLMAFSAGVVESTMVVDRWLYLREQGVKHSWVEPVFDYGQSPRNLVVVGIKS